MKNILFICQANIGRSQMAEAFYNKLSKTNSATSAACEDFVQKYNSTITSEIVDTMDEIGIDITNQRMKLLTPKMVSRAEKIIVLCDRKFCPEFLLSAKDKVIIKTLKDPHDCDPKTVSQIRDQIIKIVEKIIIKESKNAKQK